MFVLADALQRFGFYLANSFSGYAKLLANLFQGMGDAVFEPESHLQYFLLLEVAADWVRPLNGLLAER